MARQFDFSSAVKREAWQLSSGFCPLSGCTERTWQASDDGRVEYLGDVAHIVAASDDLRAPRSPQSLSAPEREEFDYLIRDRAGIANAIALCTNCHRKADLDAHSFTVRDLVEAKQREHRLLTERSGPWDVVQRKGLASLVVDDFDDDPDVLSKLIAAIAADGRAQHYADCYGDRAKITRLSFGVDTELANERSESLVYLAECAVQLGEWAAAERLWRSASDRASRERRGRRVAARAMARAASAATRDGRPDDAKRHIEKARHLAPDEPAVIAADFTSPMELDKLSGLDRLSGRGEQWERIRHAHRCLSFLLKHDTGRARRELQQMRSGRGPDMLRRGLELNCAVEEARLAEAAATPSKLQPLEAACDDGKDLLAEQLDRNRPAEAVRTRMLVADGLALLGRFDEARNLIQAATEPETARPDDRGVMVTAALHTGNVVEAFGILGPATEADTSEARLLRARARARAPVLSHAVAIELIDGLRALLDDPTWVAKAAAATMLEIAATSDVDWPEDAIALLPEKQNVAAIERAKRVRKAAARASWDAWRDRLGPFAREPLALRNLLLQLEAVGAPDAVIEAVSRALLELDCNATSRYLAATALIRRERTRGDGLTAAVALGRDRNAPAALRAEAYDCALRELRRLDRLPDLRQLFTEEVIHLGRQSNTKSVMEVANKWMPSANSATAVPPSAPDTNGRARAEPATVTD